MCNDSDYFRRRADEERMAAISSTHPKAKQCHVDLANAYDRHARTFAAEERRSAFHLISEVDTDLGC
jgi:hypothetical protein